MSDVDDCRRAADGLNEVTLAMEDVDLNVLLDDDVRELLECKEALSEMTLRYRQNQHAMERWPGESEADETAGAEGGDAP